MSSRWIVHLCAVAATAVLGAATAAAQAPLGLPPLPVPADNPMTPAKVALGKRLFEDKRFSSTGEVNCQKCHAPEKAFTDGPLSVSEGINALTGTRNAPTVLNGTTRPSSGTAARRRSRIRLCILS
jgi:cytochrome c peroxidase